MPQSEFPSLESYFERAVSDIIVREKLIARLNSSEKLRVYLGVDPTTPHIHLGHTIALRLLRAFQEHGHTAILLIGDFTAQIGDPTGKDTMRKPLTREEIEKNFKEYKNQASTILDFDSQSNPAQIAYNSEWLSKLSLEDIVKLSSHFTVQQMSERDMFQKRIQEGKPVGLHEFLYPLMQGYDSVALKADVELGGTDQTFNMLAGRTLRKQIEGAGKHVITTPLLLGTDGRKMSKSYNNTINITDAPEEMFGKIMSMRDELMGDYFKLLTTASGNTYKELIKNDPRNAKALLGRLLVEMYHSSDAAKKAELHFNTMFKNKETPDGVIEFTTTASTALELAIEARDALQLPRSNSELKRLFQGGGVKINDRKVTDFTTPLINNKSYTIYLGKKHIAKGTK